MAPRATSSSYLGLIKEPTRGTYQSPVTGGLWVPYRSPAPEDDIKYLDDTGLRGSMVSEYNVVEGVSMSSFSYTCDFFTDTGPGLVQAILGGTDVVASSTSYTHVFSLLNNAASVGNQPTSWSLTDFDGYESRQYVAAAMGEVTLKWQADGMFEMDNKWITNLSASTATVSSGFSTNRPIPAWETVASVGGVSSLHIEQGEISFKRKTEQPFTGGGSQSPFFNFLGALETTFKFTCLAEDDTEYNYFRFNTQPTLLLQWTDPVTGNTFQIAANDAAYTTGKPIRTKEYLQWDVSGKLVPNTTNASSGGFSPVQCTAVNARNTAY